MNMWQPIETAPKDRFLLLCGPSGYTTTPRVFVTGCMYSDYHVGRWVDPANDDLSDWGFEPTHWMPLPEAPGAQAQPAPSIKDAIIDDLQSQFDSEGITEHDSGDALIRLSDAIAAVEDNFVQSAPSVPDTYAAGINAVAAMLQSKAAEYAKEHGHDDMGGLSFGSGMGGEIKMDYYTNLVELVDDVRAMLADAPEAKP